jgi:hypothetical protein
MAAALPIAGGVANETYTWSAELVAVDEGAKTVTVQAPLVSDAKLELGSLDEGDRLTLTWSGINTAAGVRHLGERAPSAEDRLVLPVEFVSTAHDDRYVRFKVAVPTDDLEKLAALTPGSWVTATSPRGGASFEEAVAELRPYNDVG